MRADDKRTIYWLFAIAIAAGIAILIPLLLYSPALGASECYPFTCEREVWVLEIGGDDIEEFDTEEECQKRAAELDPQTRPFMPVTCRHEWVNRTDS